MKFDHHNRNSAALVFTSTISLSSMPQPVYNTSQSARGRGVKADLLHRSQYIGESQVPECPRTMLIQVWHGENCLMEPRVFECGTSAQTNGCPLSGAEWLTLNEVSPLIARFPATSLQPPAPPTNSSHGPSASAIVAILALVVLPTTLGLLFLWDYRKRQRARRAIHDNRVNQTVVIQLETLSGRLEHRHVISGPDTQASVQRGHIRTPNVAYHSDSLRMPRRPGPAAGAQTAGSLRIPEGLTHPRASGESVRTLVASTRDLRSVASIPTLRETETREGSIEMEGGISIAGDTNTDYYSSETERESSISRPRRVSSLDRIAGYRSWRSAA